MKSCQMKFKEPLPILFLPKHIWMGPLHGEGVLLSRFRQLGWNWLCCLDGGFYTPFAGIFKRTNSGLSNNTLLLYKGPIHRPTVYSYFTFSTIAKNYLLLCKASRFSQDYGLKPQLWGPLIVVRIKICEFFLHFFS